MEVMELIGQPRTSAGTIVARKLRKEGRMPAIIYGRGEDPQSISLTLHEVEVALSHGARMLKLDVAGAANQYLIKEVQYDHLDHTPLHMDLVRISMHEKVQVTVGIELRGVPKGVNEGGVLDQALSEIEIECLPTDIPETLHPLVVNLGLNETLYVRDLQVPPGVTVLTDPDDRVATVRPKVEEPEEGEAEPAAEGEAAQPEVIARGKKEEDEGGED